MSDEVQVVEARTETDRKMVGRLHTRLFELSVRGLDRLETLITDPATDNRQFLMAMKLCMERTVPVVHRITATAAMMHLPIPSDDTGPAVSLEERERSEMLALLRGILAAVSTAPAAQLNGAARPGLVLLRGGGNGAAG